MKKQGEQESEEDHSEVKIAGRPQEIYVMKIIEKFQYNDQVGISCHDRYLASAIHIIRLFETFGIFPETKSGKIEFVKSEEDLLNRETGEYYNQPINKLTLTKRPEDFRFTKS